MHTYIYPTRVPRRSLFMSSINDKWYSHLLVYPAGETAE